jgi:hypothetical protein
MGVVRDIKRDAEWQEYIVRWIDDDTGYDEGKSAFVGNDPKDAVDQLLHELGQYPETRLTKAQYTRNLIKRYYPEFFDVWQER